MRAAILISALALAACGSNEKTMTVQDGEGGEKTVTYDKGGENVKIEGADGRFEMKKGEGAAEFPAHAPQYPGSTVTASANFSGKDGDSGAMLVQETSDDAGRVVAFYKERIAASGKKIAMETTTPEGALLMVGDEAGKGGMMIMVARKDDKTSITYTGSQ